MMIELENVTGGYGHRTIIEGIDLLVAEGETVAILGVNTAGKTTLIRAISGALPHQKGHIRFEGRDISDDPPHARVSSGLACVPEGRHIFPQMSVVENLMVGAYHRRSSALDEDLEAAFTLFPRLKERRRQMAGTLSGGEQQMVSFCRAMMARPKLLLMDEPSHGLAPMMVEEVHSAINDVNSRGIAVLLVEQNVSSALRVASRGYVLDHGRITLEGTAGELADDPFVKKTYLGI
ncbi:ABC transporter ATP-binding protein [Allosediminivita pacifica]|uniref:Amino acid/amide ABC transporter ATP-binding protein 2 (HAAT family) n=1 Tax=Allosediminivita pacifica TaxID=1267769 RepID=A0A2T6A4D3_9RHOB|nr:ABC transporter ATP-binding protein [Allosediminivita pacifica]PTX38665.1 amino acid/amide ABC transporter ATP-binding protein 2 (HAAT family) [Allosediminivita pacifica]GGB28956.1 ABC transporter ATP-binding protein [Allosediminivita pacifica]